eukprot:CAMPEP_0117460598 /NCGR_PEP_ID=MMETSP0784-20121206/2090_1 /TAXON_ID=39447 /ORGANISM="" /LENGTH=434 /DNA_ID=CAMNT_0005254275 /DNA_START=15 /DNA_END=1317 /DNA_ORIENTATION=+
MCERSTIDVTSEAMTDSNMDVQVASECGRAVRRPGTESADAAEEPLLPLREPDDTEGGHPSSSSTSEAMAQLTASAEHDKRCTIWLSVDPRIGSINVYPKDVALRIERAYQMGQRSVSLRGLGGFYDKATVEFEKTRSGRPEQRTGKGSRDVRRLLVSHDTKEIAIHVVKESRWRASDEVVPGAEFRCTPLLGHEPIPDDEIVGERTMTEDPTQQERIEAANAGTAKGLVGLWEWCRSTRLHVQELNNVPPQEWGLYVESQNATIEEAFKAGRPSAKIVIGIRAFEIVFDGAEHGRQVDHSFRKMRHVRRRLLTSSERNTEFEQAAKAAASSAVSNLGDNECAICCSSFEETPTIAHVHLSAATPSTVRVSSTSQTETCRVHSVVQRSTGEKPSDPDDADALGIATSLSVYACGLFLESFAKAGRAGSRNREVG